VWNTGVRETAWWCIATWVCRVLLQSSLGTSSAVWAGVTKRPIGTPSFDAPSSDRTMDSNPSCNTWQSTVQMCSRKNGTVVKQSAIATAAGGHTNTLPARVQIHQLTTTPWTAKLVRPSWPECTRKSNVRISVILPITLLPISTVMQHLVLFCVSLCCCHWCYHLFSAAHDVRSLLNRHQKRVQEMTSLLTVRTTAAAKLPRDHRLQLFTPLGRHKPQRFRWQWL